ncbi:MAG: polysaccharide deacetylase family protein [Promethearchaeota archaeon]
MAYLEINTKNKIYSSFAKFMRSIDSLFFNESFINNNIIVVLYHSVSDKKSFLLDGMSKDIFIDIFTFREQINFFYNNFNIVSLESIINPNKRKKLPRKSLIITFDDGYRDNFLNAYPILKEKGIEATICINTAFLDNKDMFWGCKYNLIKKLGLVNQLNRIFGEDITFYLLRKNNNKMIDNIFNNVLLKNGIEISELIKSFDLYLNTDDINKMDYKLIKVCPHSHNHYQSLGLDYYDRLIQIKKSNELKNLFPLHYVPIYSFPFGRLNGAFDVLDIKMLKKEGIQFFLSASGGINSRVLNKEILRIPMYSRLKKDSFYNNIYDPYSFYKWLKIILPAI